MSNPYYGGSTPDFNHQNAPSQPGYHESPSSYPGMPTPDYSRDQQNLYETGGVMPATYLGDHANSYGLPAQVPAGYNQKNWVVALILAFFLGTFGAHNFYLGYNSRAKAQLAITIISIVTTLLVIGVFGLIAMSIWAFVEFILILVGGANYDCDANGFPLER